MQELKEEPPPGLEFLGTNLCTCLLTRSQLCIGVCAGALVGNMNRKPTLLQAEHSLEDTFLSVQQKTN